jgi:hypothetical protein
MLVYDLHFLPRFAGLIVEPSFLCYFCIMKHLPGWYFLSGFPVEVELGTMLSCLL